MAGSKGKSKIQASTKSPLTKGRLGMVPAACVASMACSAVWCGVPQKNHAQHRHGIFGGREVGVGTELIGGFPQAGFNLRDVVEGVGGHLCGG